MIEITVPWRALLAICFAFVAETLSVVAADLRITSICVTNDDVRLDWDAPGGSNYILQVVTPLGGDFVDVGPSQFVPGGANQLLSYTDVGARTSATARFYRVRAVAAGPLNDNFDNRTVLTGAELTAIANNATATKELNEPEYTENLGGKSLWWTWTAPASGAAIISTCGSDFDTLLAVYTGTSLAGLSSVANNDDSTFCGPGSVQGKVQFIAEAGMSYQIVVDGYNGASGNVMLNLSYPPSVTNDNFASRIALTDASITVTGNNDDATKEPGEPRHAGNSGGKSLWWSWTASATGPVTMRTCGSSFDTLLAVYTGIAVDALTSVASNDDSGSCGGLSGPSFVQFNAVAGQIYQVAVDGYGVPGEVETGTGGVVLEIQQ